MSETLQYVQAERLLRIDSPLGPEAFLTESFSGTEGVNALFEFTVALRAKRDDVRAEELVGKNVEVMLDLGRGERRRWNGLVTALAEEPRLTRALRQYVLTLRPDLWLLSQKSDCRIWQNKTAVEVVETLLSEHGLRAPDTGGVLSPPPAQEYSVQWNETDLAYLLRRIEEDGIHYWVRHEDGGQTLALADGAQGWDDGADGGSGLERYAAGSTDRNHLTKWMRRFTFTPGARAGRDWNFETPATVPGAQTPSQVNLPRNGAYELYEYPARALDTSNNERMSRLRMQAVEANHEGIAAESTVRSLKPGAKVTPYDVAHPEHGFETAVVTAITHYAQDTTYETGSGDPTYANRLAALPARLPMTPHRQTPRPRVDGSQIALVAGPAGEEIHTDQYGRVKLWFPWDRRARKDGSDTRWVRVAQPWAGTGWGSQVIPRIGMEAVVTYEAGDPDRPIVTALVPNPQQNVPYTLPANKTRMVLRSNTHKGQGFNEFSMEDEAGRENVFQHAQKDMTTKVLNNNSRRVDAHQVDSIGQNKSTDVGGNHQEKIGGSMNLSVGGGMGAPLLSMLGGVVAAGGLDAQNGSAAIDNPLLQAFTAAIAAVGAPAEIASLGANAAVTSAGNFGTKGGTETAAAAASLGQLLSQVMPMSGVLSTVIEKFQSDTVGIARTEQVGLYKNTTVGHTMTVNAGEEFILKCGQSRLVMDKDGNITITGTKFNFAASGHVQINGEIIDLN